MQRRFETEEELAGFIAACSGGAKSVRLAGNGSKTGLVKQIETDFTIDLTPFNGIDFYEPEELVLQAGAATPLAEIEAVLAERNQMMAFEPPDWRSLSNSTGEATLGGMVCVGLSGPRRIKAGAVRDHVLGVTMIGGRGQVLSMGGRVMKNVTGYDVTKLVVGAHGTLGALTSLTMKVLPKPEEVLTLTLEQDAAAAIVSMTKALQAPVDLSGAAHVDGTTYLRLEGTARSNAARAEQLQNLIGTCKQIDDCWADMRDGKALVEADPAIVWQVSAPRTKILALIDMLAALDAKPVCAPLLDWGGARALVGLDAPYVEAMIEACKFAGGHARLIRAPQDVRAALPFSVPLQQAEVMLNQRLKKAFDPLGILNPNVMDWGA